MAKQDRKQKGATSLEEAEQREATRQTEKAANRAQGLDRIFRFGLQLGKSSEVIILEESLEDALFLHEHSEFQPAATKYVYEVCPKEFYDCPVCQQSGKDSTFTLFLSILHLNAYQDKTSGEWRDSRNLLPIKYAQLAEYKKVLKMAEKKHGTLRGVVLNLERPTGPVTQSPRIGVPTEVEEGDTRFDFIEDLEGEYGHDAVIGQDKATVIKEENLDITAFDWEVVFPTAKDPEANIEDLRNRYTEGKAPAGSDSETSAWTEEERGGDTPTRTRSCRRKSADEDDLPGVDTPPKGRGRRRPPGEEATTEADAAEKPARDRRSRKGKGDEPAEGWAK